MDTGALEWFGGVHRPGGLLLGLGVSVGSPYFLQGVAATPPAACDRRLPASLDLVYHETSLGLHAVSFGLGIAAYLGEPRPRHRSEPWPCPRPPSGGCAVGAVVSQLHLGLGCGVDAVLGG